MVENNDLYRQIEAAERERAKKERKEKWAKREKSFWKAFLFTEDGKPKSGFMVYTVCLSLVYVLLMIGAFNLSITWLGPVTAGWPVLAGNLVQSLAASAVGIGAALILHRLLPDKRLMLGTYLWLAVYGALAGVAMAFMLGDWEAFGAFLHVFLWFIAIPVILGLIVTYLLYRRDYVPSKREEDQPWKKYTQRR